MLDLVAPEVACLIFGSIISIPDLLNLRLVSKGLEALVVERLNQLAFRHIRLSLCNIERLKRTLAYVEHSSLVLNLRWLTIDSMNNWWWETCTQEEQLSSLDQRRESLHSSFSVHQLSYTLFQQILVCLSSRAKFFKGVVFEFGMQRPLEHSTTTTSESIHDMFASTGQQQREIHTMYPSLHSLQRRHEVLCSGSMKILERLSDARLHLTDLELDGTLFSFTQLAHLAQIVQHLGGLRRLSLRICGSIDSIDRKEDFLRKSSHCLAQALAERLEELVLSCTVTHDNVDKHNLFLEMFLGFASFQRLNYISLDGYALHYTKVLDFLECHKHILEYHSYENFSFTGLDHLDSAEFREVMNHEIEIRGLSHLGIDLVY